MTNSDSLTDKDTQNWTSERGQEPNISKEQSRNKKKKRQRNNDHSYGGKHPNYRGVWLRRRTKWVSEISDKGKKFRIWLGTYPKAEMAARAYDAAALALQGASASLNFPELAKSLPKPESLSPSSIQAAAAKAAAEAEAETAFGKKQILWEAVTEEAKASSIDQDPTSTIASTDCDAEKLVSNAAEDCTSEKWREPNNAEEQSIKKKKKRQRTSTCTSDDHHCEGSNHQKYRGVRWRKNGKWGSVISQKGKKLWLGSFPTAEMAARAYDAAALALKGASADLNFPELAQALPQSDSPSPMDIQAAASASEEMQIVCEAVTEEADPRGKANLPMSLNSNNAQESTSTCASTAEGCAHQVKNLELNYLDMDKAFESIFPSWLSNSPERA
ncbi:hypothetical protein ACFX15_039738 [Malus domestica]|uniref:ethylene-responsive transcription factor ERF035-like isoform X2 n=1 Tax=Malus sylvestris TaxID=3752 RepID=UPI0021AC1B1B|nr:ethylene-responsive transcription factor ERF035-like isoform X2 [Malus sylvestris]